MYLVFQFHYGTIKSPASPLNSMKSFAFQFHYGTIKRTMRKHASAAGTNFNSTMVRLKV